LIGPGSIKQQIGLPPSPNLQRQGNLFYQAGDRFLQHFIDLCHLEPGERVLDVGSGYGTKAVALAEYLNRHGQYEGFDVSSDKVSWCTRAITPLLPNFRFRQLDVFNGAYNPRGTILPSELRFPYEDDYFDFAFAISLFTHMHAGETEHYLHEMARVLRPGGRCLTTWLVLNDESRALIDEGRASFSFRHQVGDSYAEKATPTEAAVAFDEHVVRRMFERVGLVVQGDIHFGRWSGRREFLSFQDILVASTRQLPL
jgi:ubiquinone/menaquinone biosynthesis C-methylase UbiE